MINICLTIQRFLENEIEFTDCIKKIYILKPEDFRNNVQERTVEEPNGCHGDRKEVVGLHVDLDQGSSEGEEEEDDD